MAVLYSREKFDSFSVKEFLYSERFFHSVQREKSLRGRNPPNKKKRGKIDTTHLSKGIKRSTRSLTNVIKINQELYRAGSAEAPPQKRYKRKTPEAKKKPKLAEDDDDTLTENEDAVEEFEKPAADFSKINWLVTKRNWKHHVTDYIKSFGESDHAFKKQAILFLRAHEQQRA